MLLGYLLAAPKSFLLGPLALLLLLSRPSHWREWLWIGVSVAAAAIMIQLPATLSDRTIHAAGAFFTGAFVIATLLGLRSLMGRTLIAIASSAAATIAWFVGFGLTMANLRASFIAQYWATWRTLRPELPQTPPILGQADPAASSDLAHQLTLWLHEASMVIPGALAVAALGGGYLAWKWYWQLSSHPVGESPRPFVDLRFNDHLIWLLIISVAATLLAGATPIGQLGSNLLVFTGALYAARGLAVVQTALRPAPTLFMVLLSIAAFFLLPVALLSCALLGTADTWLDFRRRMAPHEGAIR